MSSLTVRPQTDIDTFLALDIRAGVVQRAEPFPEARNPALKLWIDFGADVGVRASSAQLTRRYTADELVGTMVLGVVNFPPRRIAGFQSEVLVLGVVNPDDRGDVVLVRPDAGVSGTGSAGGSRAGSGGGDGRSRGSADLRGWLLG